MTKCVLLLLCLCVSASLSAANYQVNDISVRGLQRVSSDSVFSNINVEADSSVSDTDLQQLIRDLFDTGYFADVRVGMDASTLVIQVVERPMISMILFEGNQEIPTEALIEGLKSIGLTEGEVFKASALDAIAKQLNAQYSALGRYGAQIETYVRDIEQNQVYLGIRIREGRVAKIKHINIVGNQAFDEQTLRDLFVLQTRGSWSWFSGNDKYSREKLAGDLERLKAYYLDRGYIQFAIESTQVSLSPDKESVFITVNINEGQAYRVSQIAIAGDPVLPEAEIRALMEIDAQAVFSQLKITQTEQAIIKRLNDEGYSSASVSASPVVDTETNTAVVTFFIDPGAISYVRRIRFVGNTATADHVLRREMRQLEGAPISAEKLRQSKLRLERLGLFGQVDLQTYDVPGSTDQLDVEFTVTEQPTASVNASIGYSGANGISYGAGLQHNNWLGSGNTFGFNFEQSDTETNYSLNFNNPYYTKDGVSRGISLFFRERKFDDINVSNYTTDSYGVKVNFGYPISETGRVSFGLGFENIFVEAGATTAQEIKGTPSLRSGIGNSVISNSEYQAILDYLESEGTADTNGNGFLDEKDNIPVGVDANDTRFDLTPTPLTAAEQLDAAQGFLDVYGNDFNTYSLNFGWSNSTFNRGIFPTSGLSQQFNTEVAIPGGDLEFYKVIYRSDLYLPISDYSAFRVKGRLGYASGYGNTDTLPFFENFFAGGVGSVRGFRSRSLGPKGTPANAYVAAPIDLGGATDRDDLSYAYVLDASGRKLLTADEGDVNTIGGDTLFELSAEWVFPMPFIENKDKIRTSVFVDSGNVFSTACRTTQQQCTALDLDKLSVSAGFSFQWLSPIAPLSFSFSRPLVEQPLDETQFFQFFLGSTF
ncbi:MAG: outer membrane protein assembly factor BamA [Cellvibrionaceae bacterium]|nr:outer membrane protein assembly factor BamA [Cellvibrionaceae bacterium]